MPDSLALSNAQINLEKAFNKFFDKKTGHPKFKSKHKCRWSYTTNNLRNKENPEKDSIRFDGNRIKLPKVGYVKIVEHRQHEGVIKSVVVSKERSGVASITHLFYAKLNSLQYCQLLTKLLE